MSKWQTGTLGIPEIEVYKDHVVVCGQRVERPESIAPSQWILFWERAKL